MARDKNSFILYKDMIHTARKLSREGQADLLMTILGYVNDENPEPTDPIVQIAFEPIKQHLKRDLRKWEGKKEWRSEAGRIGGLKSGESRRTKHDEQNASSMKHNEANEAVSVSGIGSVTVSGSVSERDTPPQDYWTKEEMKKLPLSECFKYAALDESWLSKNKASAKELESFNEILEQRGESHKTILDYKSHFSALKRKHPHMFKQEVKAKSMKEIEAELDRLKDVKLGDYEPGI